MKIKDKISIKLPSFCSVYYPEHKNVSVTGKYGKSMVSDLEINYLKKFFKRNKKLSEINKRKIVFEFSKTK